MWRAGAPNGPTLEDAGGLPVPGWLIALNLLIVLVLVTVVVMWLVVG